MMGMLILLLVVILAGIFAAVVSKKKERFAFMYTGAGMSILSFFFLISALASGKLF